MPDKNKSPFIEILCPICSESLSTLKRYPLRICWKCINRATDSQGRPVAFFNVNIFGGCKGSYRDTSKAYDSEICYIDGIECIAKEAYFGGIVIQKTQTKQMENSAND